MQIRLEITPSRQPEKVLKDILKIDRICFEADPKVETKDVWFWVVRNDQGKPIGYAGMRACKMKCNEGLAFMVRSGVVPHYRGRGIQKKLIKARVAHARRLGFAEIITYVLSWNLASANSLIGCGFKLYTPTEAYAGSKAFYFRKQL